MQRGPFFDSMPKKTPQRRSLVMSGSPEFSMDGSIQSTVSRFAANARVVWPVAWAAGAEVEIHADVYPSPEPG
jgi:hypothetical protein